MKTSPSLSFQCLCTRLDWTNTFAQPYQLVKRVFDKASLPPQREAKKHGNFDLRPSTVENIQSSRVHRTESMATTSSQLNVTRELNISFENLSYSAKVGLFKRRKLTHDRWSFCLRFFDILIHFYFASRKTFACPSLIEQRSNKFLTSSATCAPSELMSLVPSLRFAALCSIIAFVTDLASTLICVNQCGSGSRVCDNREAVKCRHNRCLWDFAASRFSRPIVPLQIWKQLISNSSAVISALTPTLFITLVPFVYSWLCFLFFPCRW